MWGEGRTRDQVREPHAGKALSSVCRCCPERGRGPVWNLVTCGCTCFPRRQGPGHPALPRGPITVPGPAMEPPENSLPSTLSALTAPEPNHRGGDRSPARLCHRNSARRGWLAFPSRRGWGGRGELGALHAAAPRQTSSPNTAEFQHLDPRVSTDRAFLCVAIIDEPSRAQTDACSRQPCPGSQAGRAEGGGGGQLQGR